MKSEKLPNLPEIADEAGMAERFQRGLQRALNTPRKPHQPSLKPKEQPALKGKTPKSRT